MTILKNSAKCDACGVEIESKTRHDFVVHYCVENPHSWTFAVDGGKNYIKRCGSGFTDTSIESEA